MNMNEESQNPKITYKEAAQLDLQTVDEVWSLVKKTCDEAPIEVEPLEHRKGWKTVRIFVSSTFRDFHQEREVLVKEVFPDLRLWCEQRKLKLVECDLRWGVPKETTADETFKICLSELDRCYDENVAPFFLNLAGQRTGWVPNFGDIDINLAEQYGWIHGLSVTEMEIVHGAFRKLNPNALFMLRNNDCLSNIPQEKKPGFVDTAEKQKEKLAALRKMIEERFPESSIHNYNVKGVLNDGNIEFEGLTGDSDFSHTVFNFFQSRIEKLYPLDPSPEDPLQVQKEAHETFLSSRSQCVLGRGSIIDEVSSYIHNENQSKSPLLIVGTAGAGKSALMAKCAAETVREANNKTIPVPGNFEEWKVFFHFVGATPRSEDLIFFLQRFVREVDQNSKETASDLDTLIQRSNRLLESEDTQPIILFIDAVNQFDEDQQHHLKGIIPDSLSPNVRLIISTIDGTQSHEILTSFQNKPTVVTCGPLDTDSRKEIMANFFRMYNKKLHADQEKMLIEKDGSENPLWLTLACEELRVFGVFETLEDKIKSLPDELISLEKEVFNRFEQQENGELMIATLCLLEASRHGLLETELLALLGDERNIKCPEYRAKKQDILDEEITVTSTEPESEKNEEDETKNETGHDEGGSGDANSNLTRKKGKQIKFLPARDWAIVYRNLKSLLRPCGDLGEGRLDFYHQSLRTAVTKKYFDGSEELVKHIYDYWHRVLARFFQNVDDFERKAEELPYHLEKLGDTEKLQKCLLDWNIFNELYDEDFSPELLHLWQEAGGYEVSVEKYKQNLDLLKESGTERSDYVTQMKKVAIFFIQSGDHEEALKLLESCAEIETNELGERADQLADIYKLIAQGKSEIIKLRISGGMFATEENEQLGSLEENKEVIEMCRKSQSYREQLQGEENELQLYILNILLCEHLSNVGTLTDDRESLLAAHKAITESLTYFKKINDLGHASQAALAWANAHPNDQPKFIETKFQLMSLALYLCTKAYGEKHMFYVRICLSIGDLYTHIGKTESAKEYYDKAAKASKSIYGQNNRITHKALVEHISSEVADALAQMERARQEFANTLSF